MDGLVEGGGEGNGLGGREGRGGTFAVLSLEAVMK